MSQTEQTYNFKPGEICHTEILTNDEPATKQFMASVFGWGYEEMPMPDGKGTYTMWKVGDRMHGGITPPQGGGPPAALHYLAVEDADATVAAIEANGGKVLQAAFNVGEFGRMAVFQEPGGVVMAIWQELANK